MIFGRHPHRRITFVLIVAVCWGVGLLGLERSRMSAFQLPVVVGAGLLALWVVGALRRRLEARLDSAETEAIASPPSCVVIRRLGQEPSPVPTPPPAPVRPRIELVETPAAPRRRPAAPRRPARARRHTGYIPLTGI